MIVLCLYREVISNLFSVLFVFECVVVFVYAASKSICYTDFEHNSKESTYVDKTLFIKDLLEDSGQKIVITAPRGFGKTANLHTLKAFLALEVDKHGKTMTSMKDRSKPIKDTPNYKLFQQLKIKDHKDIMAKHFGKYPVIHVDYKSVVRFLYFNETQNFFKEIFHETVMEHCYLEKSDKLFDDEKEFIKLWCSDEYEKEDMGSLMPGLQRLAKYLFKHFDRTRVVILVDHYDSPVYSCIFDPDTPDDVLKYTINQIQLLFDIVKDDFYVDMFYITGVSQIEESHVSNAKIIKRYEFLNEHRFVPYFGLQENEVFDILGRYTIEVDNNIFDAVQNNYGGYLSMNNFTMHNVWAILQYLHKQKLDHVWARTSDIPRMNLLLKIPDIHQKIEMLLKGIPVGMELKKSFSSDNLMILRDLLLEPRGKEHLLYTTLFYSFMFEQGFLSYDPEVKPVISEARRYFLPNEEVKEYLWKELNE